MQRLALLWLLLLAPAAEAAGCSCDDFCAGSCQPFDSGKLPPAPTSAQRVQNMTLYRFTPRSVRSVLADTNTGDADGDLGFFLDRRSLTARCALEPTNLRCFLAPWSQIVFAKWELEIDTGWGPYLACNPAYDNPNGTAWNLDNYLCSQACVVPPFCGDVVRKNNSQGGDGQITCYCDRANRSVGVESFGAPRTAGARATAQSRSALPPVCTFGMSSGAYSGTAPIKCDKHSVLRGEVIQSWEGPTLEGVAEQCCAACSPPHCKGYSITQRTSGFVGKTLGGDLTVGAPPAGEACVASSARDQLPGGSWNWGTMGVSGGSWFSTPANGQCREGQRVGDGSGCTWRVLRAPSFIESTCVNDKLDAAVMEAAPSCFASCPTAGGGAVDTQSECFYRCYWLALHANATSAQTLWASAIRPTFLNAWPTGSAEAQGGACPAVEGALG